MQRLNHAVLYVRDAERSATFYGEVLGFTRVDVGGPIRGAVFLRAPGSTNDHDLGLFSVGEAAGPSQAGKGQVGLYHLAWEVDTLAELARLQGVLAERGALVGASDHSTTKSLYARDADGIELEIVWVVPAAMLDEAALEARGTIAPLDIGAEQARYGAATIGGIGVSVR